MRVLVRRSPRRGGPQAAAFLDTPNHGGVYKAWVTPLSDFQAGCSVLGHGSDYLTIVDCGFNAGNAHGFIPSNSKTDNFKVKEVPIIEIDTRFYYDRNGNRRPDSDEAWVDGLGITWIDPGRIQRKVVVPQHGHQRKPRSSRGGS